MIGKCDKFFKLMTEFNLCKFVNTYSGIDKSKGRNFDFVQRQFLPAVISLTGLPKFLGCWQLRYAYLDPDLGTRT